MKNNTNNSKPFHTKEEFKKQFELFYPALCLFAKSIVHDNFIAEDVVQDTFIRLWEMADVFENSHAVKSFLYTSVKNKCLNHIEHDKVKQKHREFTQNELINNQNISNQIIEEETHRLIYNAINELPHECKNVLLLSIQGLKNHEIANELLVSINTVKTQKKIAYKQLRIKLKDVYLLAGIILENNL